MLGKLERRKERPNQKALSWLTFRVFALTWRKSNIKYMDKIQATGLVIYD